MHTIRKSTARLPLYIPRFAASHWASPPDKILGLSETFKADPANASTEVDATTEHVPKNRVKGISTPPISTFLGERAALLSKNVNNNKDPSTVVGATDMASAFRITETVSMPKGDFEALLHENAALRQQVCQLTNNADLLRETIRVNDITIDELRKENETLKLQLIVLKADREDMKVNISKLNAMELQISKINAMELQISKINARLERQDRDEKIRKLQISIQDLNSKEELEKTCSPSVRQNLARLRSSRNTEYHYLDDRDSASLTEYKEHILLDQLKNVSYPVALQFEALFGTGLLEEIERILDRKLRGQGKIAISGEDQARVELWWGL